MHLRNALASFLTLYCQFSPSLCKSARNFIKIPWRIYKIPYNEISSWGKPCRPDFNKVEVPMHGLTASWRIHKQWKWVYLLLPSLLKTEYQLISSLPKTCKQDLLFWLAAFSPYLQILSVLCSLILSRIPSCDNNLCKNNWRPSF